MFRAIEIQPAEQRESIDGRRRAGLEAFIRKLGLRHFTPAEVILGCAGGLPAPDFWDNIAPVLIILDVARERLGRPIRISPNGGAWRSAEANLAVGGHSRSQHLIFGALDVSVGSPRSWGAGGQIDAQRLLRDLLRDWRGIRLFEMPIYFRAQNAHPEIPRRALEVWDRRGATASRFVFEGGIGAYPSFTHVDCRGIRADWEGR